MNINIIFFQKKFLSANAEISKWRLFTYGITGKKNINYWITLINSTNWRFNVTFKNLFVIPRISLHGLHDKSTYSNKLLYP